MPFIVRHGTDKGTLADLPVIHHHGERPVRRRVADLSGAHRAAGPSPLARGDARPARCGGLLTAAAAVERGGARGGTADLP
ncbi:MULTISPECIES: hypothetical protein [unclassified Streptomyces]|uniref:hypothetical protein n=1 Tax=unclassified Streptomyces TaxID=2593676 RepID=UPI0005258FF9|nr:MULTISPECIES: hypothetical protein [unclassified Streptomyces]